MDTLHKDAQHGHGTFPHSLSPALRGAYLEDYSKHWPKLRKLCYAHVFASPICYHLLRICRSLFLSHQRVRCRTENSTMAWLLLDVAPQMRVLASCAWPMAPSEDVAIVPADSPASAMCAWHRIQQECRDSLAAHPAAELVSDCYGNLFDLLEMSISRCSSDSD